MKCPCVPSLLWIGSLRIVAALWTVRYELSAMNCRRCYDLLQPYELFLLWVVRWFVLPCHELSHYEYDRVTFFHLIGGNNNPMPHPALLCVNAVHFYAYPEVRVLLVIVIASIALQFGICLFLFLHFSSWNRKTSETTLVRNITCCISLLIY